MQKFLICGLGNPGSEYANSRHNIGFDVVSALAIKYEAHFTATRHALSCRIKIKGHQVLLIQPQTYMNESGKAVAYYLQEDKLKPECLLVVTDDIALAPGKLRLRSKGSDGGHNGLKSIINALGHSDFSRLRFGAGNDFTQGKQVEYVLSKWTAEQEESVKLGIKNAIEAIETLITLGLGPAMTRFNQ